MPRRLPVPSAMISAATGAVALVIAPLVASHGVDYFLAAVILGGVFHRSSWD